MAYKSLPMAALAATLALTACQHYTTWNPPPGVDEAQFHRDNFSCTRDAKLLVGDTFVMGPPLMVAAVQSRHDSDMRAAIKECMLGKNYTIAKEEYK